jgi:hypothetical protein
MPYMYSRDAIATAVGRHAQPETNAVTTVLFLHS